MGKNKLKHFAEISKMPHVFEPAMEELVADDFPLKGKWRSDFFNNSNPIVLELGCGKGEYTVGLAERYPEKNFIGVDIKGARIWRGAKDVEEKNINNAAFLRTQIDFITAFFDTNEVDEIWITFPDPQQRKNRKRKRLTGPFFLERYRIILKPNAPIHLKTDSTFLYEYSIEVMEEYNHEIIEQIRDLYNVNDTSVRPELREIRTHYEQLFYEKGNTIKYLQFKLNDNVPDWVTPKITKPHVFFDK